MQISRDNTNRRTYVGINVEGRDVKSLVNEIQETLDEELDLPSGYYIRYGGAFENLERASKRLSLVVPLALALIFMLVFFAVKSFKQTLMIYVAVPFAAIGGIFSLYLRGMPFSISAGVGFIVLFGVAVLNGLVLISGFNELKAEGKLKINEIIKKGSIRRIRPILLTASTDILGFLPMAVSVSAGAEVQRPLATVVIGGMLTSTLLTLIVLPILYRWVESGKFKLRLPKFAKVTIIALLLFTGIGISNNTNAQDTTFTLNQAIERAKEHYPSIKSAQLEIDKQKALKSTAFDFGNTNLYTGKEEVGLNSVGINNQFGIKQAEIDVFGIPSKIKLNKSKTDLAISGKKLTENQLVRNVSFAWYRVLYTKQYHLLYIQLDSIYENFQKAAELRYNTQQTSKLEYLSATAKYKELLVTIKKAESDYLASLQKLNQYLLLSSEFDINSEEIEKEIFNGILNDSLLNNPILNYYSNSIKVAESIWKVEKAGFYPKLDAGFVKQQVEGVNGFSGWEVGVSVPILFFAKSGKTKASQLDYKIAGNEYEQKRLEISTLYNQLINRYLILEELIRYYRDEALPLADEQIEASYLAYRLGSINYVQFIQNIESAVKTKQEFLNQQAEYFELSSELKYITGQ
jgi:cobalt-zinc-cadmium resistance protein CzcA